MAGALEALLAQPGEKPVVLDGGLGTTLRDTFKQDVSGAVWSSKLLLQSEGAEVIYKAHLAFLESGSDAILTGTYQADVQGFAALGCDKAEAEEKMRLAVELALRAKRDWVESPPFKTSGRLAPAVGLSLGSYGALLLNGEEFTGKYPEDQKTVDYLANFHLGRLRVFTCLLSSLDFIAFETVPIASEVRGIRQAMSTLAAEDSSLAGIPFYVGLTCPSGVWADEGGLAEARKALWEGETSLPFGVALNCTEASALASLIPDLAPNERAVSPTPHLILYPNHNVRFLDDAAYWNNFSNAVEVRKDSSLYWASSLVTVARDAVRSGKWASKPIVGGCCGTGLVEIKVLRGVVDGTQEESV